MTDDLLASIQALAAERSALIADLRVHPAGLSWCEKHTRLCDDVVRLIASDLGSTASQVAIIAVGGYGRRELSPHSDIDLTLVPESDGSAEIDQAARLFFQRLHDAFGSILGMEVGYAYRLVADAAGLDAKTRTGLLDARLITGSPSVFSALQDALEDSFAPGEFIVEKIRERQAMMAKYNDTPLVVEPHLKEGAGGMRCFHCANWLKTAVGEREARPRRAYDATVKLRNVLHAVSGKKVDHLTRPRQQQVCEWLGVEPFGLMSEQAANAVQVHGYYLRAVEKLQEARFKLSRGSIAIRGEARILAGADSGDAAIGIAIGTRLGLRVPDLPAPDGVSTNGASAAYALSRGEETIRQIDRSGLLDQLLPELTACRTLIPNDSVHAFTVFEHSLRVVREIEEASGVLAEWRDSLHDIEALYLAALLHDVGKAESEAEHALIGADIARKVGERWSLSPRVTESVAWLIEHHLETAHVIRFRDIAAPPTAQDFARLAGDQDRLNMLALLCYADIRAVAPDLWTRAQDALLRELHERTAELLEPLAVPVAPSARRARLMRELASEEASGEELHAFVSSLPVHYLNSTPFDLVRIHMGMVARARQGPPVVDLVQRPDIAATDFTVCCLDSPGLLRRILGTFYALDLRVQGIRACTTSAPGTAPVALDVFTVNFNGRPVPSATAGKTLGALNDVLCGTRDMERLVRERGKDPEREQRVLSYRYIEGNPGILEVRAPRGRGLPFRLSNFVSGHGWNVHSARLGQWADNASAALYLTKQDGSTLSAEEVHEAMRNHEARN